MNKNEILKTIKGEVQTFFEKMGFDNSVKVEQKENERGGENLLTSVAVDVDEPQILIGKGGEMLISIQYLLAKFIKKKIGREVMVDLDINDYKKRKIDFLKEVAKTIADEVSLKKTEKELEPMPAYERRIIHLTLQERKDILTESRGEGEQRRIVIKPKS